MSTAALAKRCLRDNAALIANYCWQLDHKSESTEFTQVNLTSAFVMQVKIGTLSAATAAAA